MAPGAAARNVEESKVATYGDVPPHQLVTFGVGVYGGLGPAAVAFLKRTQWRFSGRRYLAEDAVEADEVDEEGDEEGSGGEDARAGRGGSMGWKVAPRRADEVLALMDRAREDAFEETDYATQAERGDGAKMGGRPMGQEQHGQSSDGAGAAGRMASQLLKSMEEVSAAGMVGG
ncbi:hypothetical protein CYMTET_48049 [Cymbomonas tetramitiformis]|uniref:Uncharacterized protein n=1 Tax=Cymbomonas tetramitiformis TaxID=36881 RepID=A0AAE0EVJ1_9CHLO|nr:hypothetical protein CYMTET_48049 [Cymbomonas tetramitiformis]